MSIEAILKQLRELEQLRDVPPIEDATQIAEILGRYIYAKDDIIPVLNAVMSAYKLQLLYNNASSTTVGVYMACIANKPKPIQFRKIDETCVMSENLVKYKLCDKREPITTDVNEYRTFLEQKDALEWRVRSALACEKAGSRSGREYVTITERDLRAFEDVERGIKKPSLSKEAELAMLKAGLRVRTPARRRYASAGDLTRTYTGLAAEFTAELIAGDGEGITLQPRQGYVPLDMQPDPAYYVPHEPTDPYEDAFGDGAGLDDDDE